MKRINVLVLAAAVLAVFGVIGQQSTASEETVDIWKAAWTGNLEVINQHLAAGTDVNAKAPSLGVTPLRAAAIARSSSRTVCLLSIRAGARSRASM